MLYVSIVFLPSIPLKLIFIRYNNNKNTIFFLQVTASQNPYLNLNGKQFYLRALFIHIYIFIHTQHHCKEISVSLFLSVY